MEKKTKLYLAALVILLAITGGAILGFKMAGTKRPEIAPGSSLDTRELKELEHRLEEGSSRSLNGIEHALGAAGSIEETERNIDEGLSLGAERARSLEDGIGRIGEGAEGISGELEDIGGIVEELRKRITIQE